MPKKKPRRFLSWQSLAHTHPRRCFSSQIFSQAESRMVRVTQRSSRQKFPCTHSHWSSVWTQTWCRYWQSCITMFSRAFALDGVARRMYSRVFSWGSYRAGSLRNAAGLAVGRVVEPNWKLHSSAKKSASGTSSQNQHPTSSTSLIREDDFNASGCLGGTLQSKRRALRLCGFWCWRCCFRCCWCPGPPRHFRRRHPSRGGRWRGGTNGVVGTSTAVSRAFRRRNRGSFSIWVCSCRFAESRNVVILRQAKY
ncbi:unnamed protein product [Trypanosoma congolense IL3000]|uniref:WGS project CAEQ00000000 data, annotated contig 1113 n=1 Tax=Trypanosoma congolense (strain IL3000) TaxID=1068625 RepID=F9W3U8_TRYCI|nr:unnamed protein product [Trypanosoma congolense IL3000]